MSRRIGLRFALVGWMIALVWIVACSSDPSSPETNTPALPDGSTTTPSGKELSDASATGDVQLFPLDSSFEASLHDASADADADADAAPPTLEKVSGTIDFNGPMKGVTIDLLAPTKDTLVTDDTGGFFFYAPQGSTVVIKATPPSDAGAYPMIRGVVAEKDARPRVFYLQSKADLDVLPSLGITNDESKAIVEVDFRNAQIGGFGATLKNAGSTVTPGYGVAYDENGDPKSSMETLVGGDGTTLLLGNITPTDVSFTPVVPQDAGAPCTPCDAPVLPLQSGVVTWFDFECGSANCH